MKTTVAKNGNLITGNLNDDKMKVIGAIEFWATTEMKSSVSGSFTPSQRIKKIQGILNEFNETYGFTPLK